MDMMELRRRMMEIMASGAQNLNLLRTLTFERTYAKQTITPDADWADYDFLLFIPDLTITAQEGQTSGNWLYFGMTGDRGSSTGYDSSGGTGIRDLANMLFLTKGWNSDRYYWRWCFISGRGGTLQLKSILDINSETFADLTYQYGGYYSGTNGVLTGTVKVYGGKLPA